MECLVLHSHPPNDSCKSISNNTQNHYRLYPNNRLNMTCHSFIKRKHSISPKREAIKQDANDASLLTN